jgi:pilus assembly protein CpaE
MTQPLMPNNNFAAGSVGAKEVQAVAETSGAVAPGANSAFLAAQNYNILVIAKDVGLWERLSAVFAEENHLNLRWIRSSVAEFENAIPDIDACALVVMDVGKGNVLDLNALERLKRTHLSEVPVLAISSSLDQMTGRGLMRAKADDWLPADCAPAEFRMACERALNTWPAGAARNAKCTTFFPANGGCGNTTLAVQTAFLLGGAKKQLGSVCLVDLNFQDGAIADYLDIKPAFQLSAVSKVPGGVDHQMLNVMLTRHSSGLSVLAAPASPGSFADISGELIASILGLLSESFEHLVIDLPKTWHPWTDNVVWGSERVFVVASFTIPALRHARRIADAIAAKAALKAQVSVLVNKFYEPIIGAGLTRKDAESVLGARLAGFIPNLGSVVDDAINRGMTLGEMRAGQKIDKRLLPILESEHRRVTTQRLQSGALNA